MAPCAVRHRGRAGRHPGGAAARLARRTPPVRTVAFDRRMRFRFLLSGAVLAALLASGCGRENPRLIPRDDADALIARVEAAGQASAAGDCAQARDSVAQAKRQVSELPRRVSRRLENNLQAWLRHLDDRIEADCTTAAETPTPTPTETPTKTPTPTPTKTK